MKIVTNILALLAKVQPKIKPLLIMVSGVLVAITAYNEYVKQHLPTDEKPQDNGHVEQPNTTSDNANS